MDKWNKFIVILAIICSFLIGGLICGFLGRLIFPKIKVVPEIITIYDSSKEEAKIDSLNKVISGEEARIAELLDSVKNIKTVVVVKEIEKIKELPATENIALLHDNLVKHGEFTEETDSLPAALPRQNDTLALLSENNVKDVNIIVSKYEGEVEINDKLGAALEEEENIVCQKDSIIGLQSSIMLSQEMMYTTEIKGLERNLKSEKTKKIVWISVLGTIAAALTVVAIAK